MSLLGFLVLLFVAAVCGSIGSAIAGTTKHGCLTNIALGFIGAIIGTWLSNHLGIRDFVYFYRIPIVWSIIGAALFVAGLNLVQGQKSQK